MSVRMYDVVFAHKVYPKATIATIWPSVFHYDVFIAVPRIWRPSSVQSRVREHNNQSNNDGKARSMSPFAARRAATILFTFASPSVANPISFSAAN